jgi:mono/diheme cytochrome c family protein
MRLLVLACVAVIGIGAVALTSIGLAPSSATKRPLDPNDAERVERGARLYAEYCAACHGAGLEGQPNWRERLPEGGLPAPPHDETGHTWHHEDQVLFDYTKFGGQQVVGPGFESNMPGFGEDLSDEQIWAVLSFIKSTWPERERDFHDQLYEANRNP